MPSRMKRLLTQALLSLFMGLAGYASQSEPHKKVAALIEQGNRDLDRYYFRDAEESLEQAVKLDPNSATAHNLLARALVGQLPPNLHLFPDVEHLLPRAEIEARKSVELNPDDASAWCTMGIVKRKLADVAGQPTELAKLVNEADQAFKHALALDTNSYEAHYELGKMALDTAAQPLILARAESGIPLGQPGRIRDPETIRRMQSRYSPQINEGINQTQQALNTSPNSWVAMRQMAGLLQERCLLQDTEKGYEADLNAAGEWSRKADASVPHSAPPPAAAMAQAAKVAGIVGSIPDEADRQSTVLVLLPDAAKRSLVKRVDPVLPSSPRGLGLKPDVEIRAIIDKQGHVRSAQLIGGNAELLTSARDAINKWEYRPVLVYGAPKEFVTTIYVHFVQQ